MGDSIELHEDVAKSVQEMTSGLLGATIAYSESDWAAPSRLPGWSRAHVASHLAENAKALREVIQGVQEGRVTPLNPGEPAHSDAIQEGAARSPLALQIALDTSAGQLAAAFAAVKEEELTQQVNLAGVNALVRDIPLARLHEVVLHHEDLRDGFSLADVDDQVALWCLQWHCRLLQAEPTPPDLYLIAEEGFTAAIGEVSRATEIRGTARRILSSLRYR